NQFPSTRLPGPAQHTRSVRRKHGGKAAYGYDNQQASSWEDCAVNASKRPKVSRGRARFTEAEFTFLDTNDAGTLLAVVLALRHSALAVCRSHDAEKSHSKARAPALGGSVANFPCLHADRIAPGD